MRQISLWNFHLNQLSLTPKEITQEANRRRWVWLEIRRSWLRKWTSGRSKIRRRRTMLKVITLFSRSISSLARISEQLQLRHTDKLILSLISSRIKEVSLLRSINPQLMRKKRKLIKLTSIWLKCRLQLLNPQSNKKRSRTVMRVRCKTCWRRL